MSLGPLCTSSLEKCLFWSSAHFNRIVSLPGVESCEFFIYFGDQTLARGIIDKYVFPYSWFPFHFANVFFSHAEAFEFDIVSFLHSFFYNPCLGDTLAKILLRGISHILLPCFEF